MPTLPPHYVKEDEEVETLISQLLGGGGSVVALKGMGGVGKTVLATAACLDPRVRTRYLGGIYWISVGQDESEKTLVPIQKQFIEWVSGEKPQDDKCKFDQWRERLLRLLERMDESCLLVLDDVWDVRHAKLVEVRGTKSNLLVTTRNTYLASHCFQALLLEVHPFSKEMADELLLKLSGCDENVEPEVRKDIAIKYRLLPLPLSVIACMVQGHHRPWSFAFDQINKSTFWKNPEAMLLAGMEGTGMALEAVHVSVEQLDPKQKRIFFSFAGLREHTFPPLEAIHDFWKVEILAPELQPIIMELYEKRLLLTRWKGNTVQCFGVHSIVRMYLRRRLLKDQLTTPPPFQLKLMHPENPRLETTILLIAVEEKVDGPMMKQLIQVLKTREKEIDKKDGRGCTAMHRAAEVGKVEGLRVLISVGMKLDECDANGFTPLHWAAYSGEIEALKVLITAGAKIDEKDTAWGQTPLHLASRKGEVDSVKALLAAAAKVDDKDNYGCTPLHRAVQEGNVEVVRVLIMAGAKAMERNKEGRTPLHDAAAVGEVEIVKILVAVGAKVTDVDKRGISPLHIASEVGGADMAKALLSMGAKVHEKDHSGRTPIHWAAQSGDVKAMKILLTSGASVHEQDNRGWQPLHWAAWAGRVEIAKTLIAAGALVGARDHWGRTPLMWAAERGDVEMTKALIGAGAKATDRDPEGRTALHRASVWGKVTLMMVLIAAGARIEDKDERSTWTPLHWAAQAGELDVAVALIVAGAAVDEQDHRGRTPLHLAAEGGCVEIIRVLLSGGARVELMDARGWSPLHYACIPSEELPLYSDKRLDTIKELLLRGNLCNSSVLSTS